MPLSCIITKKKKKIEVETNISNIPVMWVKRKYNLLVSKLMSGNCRNNGIEMVLRDRVATGCTRSADPRQTFTHIKIIYLSKKKIVYNYIKFYCILFYFIKILKKMFHTGITSASPTC